jgi:hypothetical protein
VNDVVTSIAVIVALVAVPVCLVRITLGPADFSALYRAPLGEAWPRGVQEAEARPWHFAGARADATVESNPGDVTALGEGALLVDEPRRLQPLVAVRGHVRRREAVARDPALASHLGA